MTIQRARVVLIETHSPGNLGAIARVMRNFGLRDMVLVAPRADPADPAALQMARSAAPVLAEARVVPDFSSAVADCVLVVGTSARVGSLVRQQNAGLPETILPLAAEVVRAGFPAALVFGPEPTGLSNDVIVRCHHLLHIPTEDECPALNLAQAVAICAYELARACRSTAAPPTLEPAHAPATFELQDQMFDQLRLALEDIHFLYGEKAHALMHAIRHLLGKARLTDMEVKVLLGLSRQIRWHAARQSDSLGEAID